MPFNSLLLTAFIPDGKWKEKGVGVEISNEWQNDTRYLLFLSDNDNFHKYLKSRCLSDSCCDLICIAQKGGVAKAEGSTKRTDTSMIVCFIELKSGRRDDKIMHDAANQILNTYHGVKYGITNESGESSLDKNITWKALIIRRREAPGNSRKSKTDPLKDLKNKFKKINKNNEENVQELLGNVELTEILKL